MRNKRKSGTRSECGKKTTPISVRMNADDVTALDALARAQNRSRSGQVTYYVRVAIKNAMPKP